MVIMKGDKKTYNINLDGTTLKIGFGSPAQNNQIVKDAETRLNEMIASGVLKGGEVIRVNGPASLPSGNDAGPQAGPPLSGGCMLRH